MDLSEIVVLLLSGYLSVKFLFKWYRLLLRSAWPPKDFKLTKYLLSLLPVVSLVIILFTLKVLASFDVIDNSIFILFYILLGYAWLSLGLFMVSYFFDLSWIDDVININNKAALFALVGIFLGLTAIYCGANIGDGPGWWCVIFAGGLGLVSWFVLGFIVNYITDVFERVTIERDVYCGIRLGCYLLASGVILGRASGGDWTSFSMTIVEFIYGWPVIPLTILMIIIEKHYVHISKSEHNTEYYYLISSVICGAVYIIIAVLSIALLSPFRENPLYDGMSVFISLQEVIQWQLSWL